MTSKDAELWCSRVKNHLSQSLDLVVPLSSVSFIPKQLFNLKPEVFTPKEVAIGPLHQFDDPLMPKIAVKVAILNSCKVKAPQIKDIATNLEVHTARTRSCYSMELDLTDKQLASMMAVDGNFVLEWLKSDKITNFDYQVSERRLLSISEKEEKEAFIHGDLFKMENQIPFLVLEEIYPLNSIELCNELAKACESISPFKVRMDYSESEVRPRHLLDLLYRVILNNEGDYPLSPPVYVPRRLEGRSHTKLEMVFSTVWTTMKDGNDQIVGMVSAPVVATLNVFVVLGITNALVKYLEGEKLLTPSASMLSKYGFEFKESNTFADLACNDSNTILYLPKFEWRDSNTETIAWNLLAYESFTSPERPIFAGYYELMHSLVRTEADVEVLVEAGLLHSEENVTPKFVKLFAELARSREVGEEKDSKMIEYKNIRDTVNGLNKFYNQRPWVQVQIYWKMFLEYGWIVVLSIILLGFLVGAYIDFFCPSWQIERMKGLFGQKQPPTVDVSANYDDGLMRSQSARENMNNFRASGYLRWGSGNSDSKSKNSLA